MTYDFSFTSKKKVIRTMLRITFFYALFFAFVNQLSAQTYYFDSYGVTEGLAASKVYNVQQDDQGYLWLGTAIGVSKFDGKEFINYSIDDGLADGAVKSIFVGDNQRVWFGHFGGGLSYFDGHKIKEHPFSFNIGGDVTAVFEGDEGELWITTYGDGLYILKNPFEEDTALMDVQHFKGSQLGDRIISGSKTKDGQIYIITDISVKKYLKESNSFETYRPEGLTNYFNITCMHEDSKGDKWFGTYNGGLYRYVKAKDKFVIYDARDGIAHNWISTIAEDSKGNVWVGTFGGGVTCFKGDEYITFTAENGLDDTKINHIKEDLEGNILIATYDHGLSIFKGEHFVTYGKKEGLLNSQVWAVTQDNKNKYWIGTSEGITVYDPAEDDSKKAVKYYNQSTNAIGDQMRYLEKDQNGNIWIGTLDNGVMEYDVSQQRFIFNPYVNIYVNSRRQISGMSIDKNNVLWIGTMDGLVYYNIKTREHKSIRQTDGLLGNEISSVFADSKGRIWVGVRDKGLNRITGNEIINIELEGSVTPACINEDKNGNIWFGTFTKGVMVCDGENVTKILKEGDGLLSNMITQLEVDENNNVYIGTNQGLNKITPHGSIYTYTKRSGFSGIEAKPNASYVDKEGNLWFGTVDGAIKYIPELDKGKIIQPLTHISKLSVNYSEREMEEGHVFNFYENSMVFEYNSVCLSNPDAVQYQIMLEGADPDWRPVTEQTMVNYSSLNPNKYEFKVRAKNSAGIWNETPISYSFTIKPPFYKTWWFILSVVVVIAALIVVYIKIRERKLVREKKILEEKVAERTAELAQKNKDIMDSIRYAQRIQLAILPPSVPFKDTFVLFKPKDIVSGDFYWFESKGDIDLLAAVDCTGHGVPGAFLSILGHNLLTKIVQEDGITDPGQILQKLNTDVLRALHQKGDEGDTIVNDGMDLALISHNKKTNELSFSGAYNPLFMIRNGEIEETKANRFAIGRSITNEEKVFTTHTMKVEKGDTVYVFSDGYADQFGGSDNRKFRKKNMKELLISIQDKDMTEQTALLENAFEEWRGNNEQIDDVVIVGKRF